MHMLFFDFALLIVTNFNVKNNINFCLGPLIKVFFEKSKSKMEHFMILKNKIKLYEKNGNDKIYIKLKKNTNLKNKKYLITFINDKNKEEILFNPFDFCFEKLFQNFIYDVEDFKIMIKNPNNFSFQKLFKTNRLFYNKNLFNEYKKNINETICSYIIDSCYNQMNNNI